MTNHLPVSQYMPVIKKCPLFAGIEDDNIHNILPCLSATIRHADKNTFIFSADDYVHSVGLILRGSVHIIQEDFWGRKDILSQLGPGELFAESFSCTSEDKLTVSVLAVEATDYLLIDCRKIIRTCTSACVFHTKLISNMLQVIAHKNIRLMQKVEQVSKRSTREKLLSYLSAASKAAGKNDFSIPFNRQELADYLSVDRSAMSSELGRMRDEGLIEFSRSHFILRQK